MYNGFATFLINLTTVNCKKIFFFSIETKHITYINHPDFNRLYYRSAITRSRLAKGKKNVPPSLYIPKVIICSGLADFYH